MKTVSITIDSGDRLKFDRVLGECATAAHVRKPNELAHADILPVWSTVGNATVYRRMPEGFVNDFLSGALEKNGIPFTVGD